MKAISNKWLAGALMGLSLCLAAGAQTQSQAPGKVKFPPGLKWQMMPMVAFDFPEAKAAPPVLRDTALRVWGDVISAIPQHPSGGKYPSFVLLGVFEDKNYRYTFSSLRAAGSIYPGCQDPINSASPETAIYTVCNLRVLIDDKSSGKSTKEEFRGHCHLYFDDKYTPASKNHTELAVSEKTAYFRVIQHGKHSRECDRAIRLQ